MWEEIGSSFNNKIYHERKFLIIYVHHFGDLGDVEQGKGKERQKRKKKKMKPASCRGLQYRRIGERRVHGLGGKYKCIGIFNNLLSNKKKYSIVKF